MCSFSTLREMVSMLPAFQRASSAGLFYNVLKASSTSAKQDAIYNGLQKIAASTIDDPQLDQSARRANRQAEKRSAAICHGAG